MIFVTLVRLLFIYLSLSIFISSQLIDNALAYHQGGNETMCWIGSDYELRLPCPDGVEIHFLEIPIHSTVLSHQVFSVVAKLDLPLDFTLSKSAPVAATSDHSGKYLIPHANLHACKSSFGWCTPNIQATPRLVSQSMELFGDSFLYNFSFSLDDPTTWTVIAHFRVFNDTDEQWDLAAAFRLTVQPAVVEIHAEEWVVLLFSSTSYVGVVISMISASIIFWFRKHWVIKASTPELSMLICIGAAVGFVSVLLFLPEVNDMKCMGRIWILCIGYDLLFFPMLVKTWRVSVLFDNKKMQKKVIKTESLYLLIAAMIFVDATFLLVWSIGHPLSAGTVLSRIEDNTFVRECKTVIELENGDKVDASNIQKIYETLAIILHMLPLLYAAQLAYRVKSAFALYRLTHNSSQSLGNVGNPAQMSHGSRNGAIGARSQPRKMEQFDESSYLTLALLSILVISIFAVAIQYLVVQDPTAATAMRCAAIVWTSGFTISVLFIPKFIDVKRIKVDGESFRSRRLQQPEIPQQQLSAHEGNTSSQTGNIQYRFRGSTNVSSTSHNKKAHESNHFVESAVDNPVTIQTTPIKQNEESKKQRNSSSLSSMKSSASALTPVKDIEMQVEMSDLIHEYKNKYESSKLELTLDEDSHIDDESII